MRIILNQSSECIEVLSNLVNVSLYIPVRIGNATFYPLNFYPYYSPPTFYPPPPPPTFNPSTFYPEKRLKNDSPPLHRYRLNNMTYLTDRSNILITHEMHQSWHLSPYGSRTKNPLGQKTLGRNRLGRKPLGRK